MRIRLRLIENSPQNLFGLGEILLDLAVQQGDGEIESANAPFGGEADDASKLLDRVLRLESRSPMKAMPRLLMADDSFESRELHLRRVE